MEFDRPIGVVFEGGGADGARELGALKSVIEHGYEPDFMAGASIGGILSALYMEYTKHKKVAPDQTVRILEDIVKQVGIFDFGGLRLDIWNGLLRNKIDYFIHERLGLESDIDDLPIAVTTTDLKKARQKVIKRGNLAKACAMTANLPGIFSPYDGRYVDGALSGNTPLRAIPDRINTVIVFRIGNNRISEVPGSIFGVMKRSFAVSLASLETSAIEMHRNEFDRFCVVDLAQSGSIGLLNFGQEAVEQAVESGRRFTNNFLTVEENRGDMI